MQEGHRQLRSHQDNAGSSAPPQLSPNEAAAALSYLSTPWSSNRQESLRPEKPNSYSSSTINTPAPDLLVTPEMSKSPATQHYSFSGPSTFPSAQSLQGTKGKSRKAESTSPDSKANTSKRRRKSTAVSSACAGCRRRKSRCDGMLPSCSTCQAHKEECIYDPDHDGRKPPSREYVQSLLGRIKALETALAERQPEENGETPTSDYVDSQSPNTAGSADASHRPKSARFKIVKNQVVAYGPTSSYLHFAGENSESNQESHSNSNRSDDHTLDDDENLWTKYNSTSVSESSSWNKWLPEGVPKDLHDELLNFFFAYVNPFTLFVDEPRFYRDLALCSRSSTSFSATAWYSPILHNVLLAMGSKYSQDPRISSARFQLDQEGQPIDRVSHTDQGLRFAETAATYLEKEWKAPFLSTVIGCMLLGTFHQVSAQPTLGWTYEGIGVRIANVLGLHMDSSELVSRGIISAELQRARIYCWATVAFQDKLWSYTHGRIPAIRMQETENTQPPPISSNMDAQPWISYPSGMKLPGLRSTIMHHTAKLTGLAERIHALNYSIQTITPARHKVLRSQIRVELMEWHSNLPQSCSIGANATRNITPAIINLNIAGWYMVVLLYRSHFRQSEESDRSTTDVEETPASICLSASHKMLNLLKMYRKQHGLRTAHPSLSNMTFCVGTIFILAAANVTPESVNRTNKGLHEDLDLSIEMLKEIGESSTFARLSAEALQGMKKEWLQPKEQSPPMTAESALQAVMSDPSKLSQLTDPVSDFSRMLKSLGWTPPTSTITAPQVSQQPQQQMSMAVNQEASPSWTAPALEPSGEMLNSIASGSSSLNPTDLALGLHPSFFSLGFAGMDEQMASLFPQHLGGEGLGGWLH